MQEIMDTLIDRGLPLRELCSNFEIFFEMKYIVYFHPLLGFVEEGEDPCSS
jgi:hypothetical protein